MPRKEDEAAAVAEAGEEAGGGLDEDGGWAAGA